MRKQTQISLAVSPKLISAFVFTSWIVRLLNPKFQVSFAQPGLCWTWSKTPKIGFLTLRLKWYQGGWDKNESLLAL